jgi:hypothetical protein
VDEVTGGSALSVDILLATFRAIATAADASAPEGQRLRPGQLDRALAETRARLAGAVRHEVQVLLLYTYQPLTDEEDSGSPRQRLPWETDLGEGAPAPPVHAASEPARPKTPL